MTTLNERLQADLKSALREGDEIRKSALRMLIAAVTNARIASQKDMDDVAVIDVIQRQIKQRRDSIEQFDLGNRPDLSAKEAAEIAILQPYLPAQLTAAELRAIVEAAVDEAGAKGPGDRGRVMGIVMPRVKGKADGRAVGAIVGELLGS